MPSTFEPLLCRLYEALEDGAGLSRALPEEHRFCRGNYPGQDPTASSRDAHVNKLAWVRLGDVAGTRQQESTASKNYLVNVVLELAYFIEPEVDLDAWTLTQASMGADVHRLVGALGEPGAHLAPVAGDDTGLASGMLTFISWQPSPPDPRARVWRAAHTFRGIVTLTH